jgi:hypothetical protein
LTALEIYGLSLRNGLAKTGIGRRDPRDMKRLYQKGTGFLVAPMMLKVRHENQETNIEAWIRSNFLVRLMSLFILPSEMGIESGGLKGVLPRNIARKAVNILLAQLGQPPIP